MSISYVNVYEVEGKDYACEFLYERTPKDAQFYAVMPQNAPRFRRVEMRFDQHWHRPPVGIKAEQCSHVWQRAAHKFDGNGCLLWRSNLVPR